MHFLFKELKICSTEEEAKEQVFFLSAKEALGIRLNNAPVVNRERLDEFNRFERKLYDCVSKSAVQTKFNKPTQWAQENVIRYNICM